VSGVVTIVFRNITSISEIVFVTFQAKGSIFTRIEELEAATAEVSPSQKSKKTCKDQNYISKNLEKLQAKN
jgi:hypothetical protein